MFLFLFLRNAFLQQAEEKKRVKGLLSEDEKGGQFGIGKCSGRTRLVRMKFNNFFFSVKKSKKCTILHFDLTCSGLILILFGRFYTAPFLFFLDPLPSREIASPPPPPHSASWREVGLQTLIHPAWILVGRIPLKLHSCVVFRSFSVTTNGNLPRVSSSSSMARWPLRIARHCNGCLRRGKKRGTFFSLAPR